MSHANGDAWTGELGGNCPVQGEGTVDDKWWYFRARHRSWQFEVFSQPFHPSGALPPDTSIIFEAAGGHDDAGWMPETEAWDLIENNIAAFREAWGK